MSDERDACVGDVERGFAHQDVMEELRGLHGGLAKGLFDSTYALNTAIRDVGGSVGDAETCAERCMHGMQLDVLKGFFSLQHEIDGIRNQMLHDKCDEEHDKVCELRAELSNWRQSEYLLDKLGRFWPYAPYTAQP